MTWLRLNARKVSATSSALSSTSRMALPASVMSSPLQLKEKSGAEARLRLDPDLARVPAEDALHDRQADPRPGKLALVVQALEGAEQPVCVRHVETYAVVGDEALLLAVAVDRAHAYQRLVGLAGELPGVFEQVLHRDLD